MATHESRLGALITAIGADIKTMVTNVGDQTINGIKTFVSAPVVPDASFAMSKIAGLSTEFARYARFAQSVKWVMVDANGNWPTSYDASTGAPSYTNGAATSGARPSTSSNVMVIWIGDASGTFPPSTGNGGPVQIQDLCLIRVTNT